MGRLLITETFDGYPAGGRRRFTAGQTVDVADIGDDYAALLIAKGLAARQETTTDETVEPEDGPADRRRRRVGA
jgi:hypothetical protein